jgi:hypothetical protein
LDRIAAGLEGWNQEPFFNVNVAGGQKSTGLFLGVIRLAERRLQWAFKLLERLAKVTCSRPLSSIGHVADFTAPEAPDGGRLTHWTRFVRGADTVCPAIQGELTGRIGGPAAALGGRFTPMSGYRTLHQDAL